MKTLFVLIAGVVLFTAFCVLALTVNVPKARPAVAVRAQERLPGSQWSGGDTTPSKMDDSNGVSYQVNATDDVPLWISTYRPVLVVRCEENKPALYVVTGTAEKPELGNFEEYTVETRWDDDKAETELWHSSTDDKALFDPYPKVSINRLAKAKRLRFRFTPFNADPAVAEFDVSGFGQDRLNKLGEACSWWKSGK